MTPGASDQMTHEFPAGREVIRKGNAFHAKVTKLLLSVSKHSGKYGIDLIDTGPRRKTANGNSHRRILEYGPEPFLA